MFFDITRESSFANVGQWLNEINNNIKENCKVVLVGTKCDLEEIRVISKEEAIEFATKNKLEYFETSSKLKINIEETVDYLCAEAMCEYYPQLKEYLHFPNEWKIENHSKFPTKFKQSIFCFLLSLKRFEKKYKTKIPKVIRIEIIKRSNPKYDVSEILKDMKNVRIDSDSNLTKEKPIIPETQTYGGYCNIY